MDGWVVRSMYWFLVLFSLTTSFGLVCVFCIRITHVVFTPLVKHSLQSIFSMFNWARLLMRRCLIREMAALAKWCAFGRTLGPTLTFLSVCSIMLCIAFLMYYLGSVRWKQSRHLYTDGYLLFDISHKIILFVGSHMIHFFPFKSWFLIRPTKDIVSRLQEISE